MPIDGTPVKFSAPILRPSKQEFGKRNDRSIMPTMPLKNKSSETLVLVGSSVRRSSVTTHGPVPVSLYSYSKSTAPLDLPVIETFSLIKLEPPTGRIFTLNVIVLPFTSPVSLSTKNSPPMPTRTLKRLKLLDKVVREIGPLTRASLSPTLCSAFTSSKPGMGS